MSTIAMAPRQVAAGRIAAVSSGVASALSDTADVAWRNLLIQLRTPQALVFATILTPLIFPSLHGHYYHGLNFAETLVLLLRNLMLIGKRKFAFTATAPSQKPREIDYCPHCGRKLEGE